MLTLLQAADHRPAPRWTIQHHDAAARPSRNKAPRKEPSRSNRPQCMGRKKSMQFTRTRPRPRAWRLRKESQEKAGPRKLKRRVHQQAATVQRIGKQPLDTGWQRLATFTKTIAIHRSIGIACLTAFPARDHHHGHGRREAIKPCASNPMLEPLKSRKSAVCPPCYWMPTNSGIGGVVGRRRMLLSKASSRGRACSYGGASFVSLG